MIVAGIMSGTSADGINVAFVDLAGRAPRLRLLAHHEFRYPAAVRRAILEIMNVQHASVADLARLNYRLGELYAGALAQAQQRSRIRRLDLIGCHGQTIYHQGKPQRYLGSAIACTWQTGEAAIIAARCGVPVVSDFRAADMAAGGQGAPLVPYLDYLVYRDRQNKVGRVLQNLGGIGNLTAIPPRAQPSDVIAFDTGPGNMVIDAVTDRLFGQPYDRDGRIAARGRILAAPLRWALSHPFFRQPLPRSAGREQFGREFAKEFLRHCGRARPEDAVATATALTARSIGESLDRYVVRLWRERPARADAAATQMPMWTRATRPRDRGATETLQQADAPYRDYILAGGGARNRTLVRMIAAEIEPLGLSLRPSDDFGIPAEAKEAVAFALLAYQTWHREPANIPSATGAERPAVLGKVSYP